MTKNPMIRLTLAAALILVAGAVPAAAQQTFQAEIDCGQDWNPGDQVPFTVRFEEQGFVTHQIDVTVSISVPTFGQFELFQGTFTLNPNEDRSFNGNINLPLSAPNGSYQMSVNANDGDEFAFDTCSFDVF